MLELIVIIALERTLGLSRHNSHITSRMFSHPQICFKNHENPLSTYSLLLINQPATSNNTSSPRFRLFSHFSSSHLHLPPLFSSYWVVCDYPQIITEVTPPRGQKAGEGVWDNSQVGFHSSRPGIGYRDAIVLFWYCSGSGIVVWRIQWISRVLLCKAGPSN